MRFWVSATIALVTTIEKAIDEDCQRECHEC